MEFPTWDFAEAPNMFNSKQSGPFPANVSSYFRRPSKVVKPSSRNTSPRNGGRRRMTTTGHFPARPKSVVDQQRASMPQIPQPYPSTSRPISWHPHSLVNNNQFHAMNQYPESYTNTSFGTTQNHGLITPMSFPIMDEPQIQELITPLEELSANDPANSYAYQDQLTQYWLFQQQLQQQQHQTKMPQVEVSGDGMYHGLAYPAWYPDNQYQMAETTTAPASPDCLPMPEYNAPVVLPEHEQPLPREELVGMGLYDSPADVQSSSLLFGGISGTFQRKTLKLEDSFEPAANTEDSDDDAEDDDDEDEDEDAEAEDDSPDLIKAPIIYGPTPSPKQPHFTVSDDYQYTMNNPYATNEWNVQEMQNQAAYAWI